MMGTKQKNGLTDSQVLTQREKYGYNELPDKEKQSLLRLILAVVREPMIFLLLTVVIVYFFLGDMSEALVLSVSVVGVISLELYQATKTEKALEALRSLASPTCSVVRDGEYLTIPSREVVVGDLLAIFEGGRVVADGRLIEAHNVAANESILTGESAVVDKSVEASDERARRGREADSRFARRAPTRRGTSRPPDGRARRRDASHFPAHLGSLTIGRFSKYR